MNLSIASSAETAAQKEVPRSRHVLILSALIISTTGDEIALVALALKAAAASGRLATVSALLVAGLLPGVLLAHLVAVCTDRFEIKRLLAFTLGIQSLIAIGAAMLGQQWELVAVAAALGGFGSLGQATVIVIIPRLYAGRQLMQANSWFETARSAGSVIGPLIAAAMIPFVGTRGALLIDAGSFLVALVIILLAIPTARLRASSPEESTDQASAASGLFTGLGILWGTPAIRLALAPLIGVAICTSVMNVALPFFAAGLHAGSGFYGLAVGAWSAGLVVGPQLLLTRLGQSLPVRLVLWGGFGVGVGLAGAGGFATPVLIFAFFVLGGACNSVLNASMRNLMMAHSPQNRRGSVGAAYGATMQAAVILGFLAPALLSQSQARWIIVVGGLLAMMIAAAGLVVSETLARRRPGLLGG